MIIKQGTHAPFRLPKLLINPSVLCYRVAFTESCRYDLGRNQGDINKLFGIGYFPHHQESSVRIGWNYDVVSGKINLFAYWYQEGVVNWQYLRSVNLGEINYFKIYIGENNHKLDVAGRVFYVDVKGRCVGYLLRPYFGGTKTSPHDIIIDMKRIK